jgi:hypothetical protein
MISGMSDDGVVANRDVGSHRHLKQSMHGFLPSRGASMTDEASEAT